MLNEYGNFVKSQYEFHLHAAKKLRAANKLPQATKRQELADKFKALYDAMKALQGKQTNGLVIKDGDHPLRPSDIADLPQEVIEQLSISESDKQEFQIVDIIDSAGGVLTLDHIIIALYRKTGEVAKRSTLNAKLYRMVKKGLIQSVPNRKGVYTSITNSEAKGNVDE